jgi:hypothetical protein
MPEDINAIKRRISNLVKQQDKRQIGFGPEDPSKWYPGSVIDPRFGTPFTREGAWDFIVDQMGMKKTAVEQTILKKPIRKVGYEFTVKTKYGEIYIKLRLGKDRIIGRSFHYSGEG